MNRLDRTGLHRSTGATSIPGNDPMVPLRIESAWGAVSVFCLLQAFGTILSNAFVFFVSYAMQRPWRGIPDGIGLLLWGAAWIILFLTAEAIFVQDMRRFFREDGARAFWTRTSRLELLKPVLALVGAAAWYVCFRAYPFPTPEPHRHISLVFLATSLAVAAIAIKRRDTIGVLRMDTVPEFVLVTLLMTGVCGVLIVGGLFVGGPLGFYTGSLLGMGGLLWFIGPILVRRQLLVPAAQDPAPGAQGP